MSRSERIALIQRVIEHVCAAREVGVRDVLANENSPHRVCECRAVIMVLLAGLASNAELGKIFGGRPANSVWVITNRHVGKMAANRSIAGEVEGYAEQLGIELNIMEGGVA